jgi:hypothetical protein
MDGRSNPTGVAREKEVALMMRRIISLVVVALVMAAMMLAMSMPVFAQGHSETAPNCEQGNDTAYFGPGSEHRNDQATDSLNKNYAEKCLS